MESAKLKMENGKLKVAGHAKLAFKHSCTLALFCQRLIVKSEEPTTTRTKKGQHSWPFENILNLIKPQLRGWQIQVDKGDS